MQRHAIIRVFDALNHGEQARAVVVIDSFKLDVIPQTRLAVHVCG